MNTSKLKKRLNKNRTMISITIRMPEDVIEDLKRVAPHRGFNGYQPLIRAYVGQGLREDLAALENRPESGLCAKLHKPSLTQPSGGRSCALE